MARQLIYISFAVIMVFLTYHVYVANAERIELSRKFSSIKSSVEDLKQDNEKLEGDLDYFKDPKNLEKEARARFNYRAPNEKMIIVVPPKTN